MGYANKLMDVVLSEIKKVKEDSPVMKEVLDSMCILTQEHFETVTSHLLKQKLPVSREVTLVFKAIANDEDLTVEFLDHLLLVINTTPIQKSDITHHIFVATSALKSIL